MGENEVGKSLNILYWHLKPIQYSFQCVSKPRQENLNLFHCLFVYFATWQYLLVFGEKKNNHATMEVL